MNEEARQARIDRILKESKRVVADATEALAAGERFFAEHGADREKLAAQVLRMGGTQAARDIEARVQRAMQAIEEENRQTVLHRQFDGTSTRTRPRRLRKLV